MRASNSHILFVAVILFIAAICVFGLYVSTSIEVSGSEVIMPLDDTYIHFQYARQLASGHPYQYNTGDPASSGATSLLYPYLLAPGYLLAFHGFDLGIWAMGIGALALFGSALIIYLFAIQAGLKITYALTLSILFTVSGAIAWHFMSGMETGVVVLLTLMTLYAFHTSQFRNFCISAALLAIARPEGSLMALIAVGLTFALLVQSRQIQNRWNLLWLLLPLVAAFAQPLLNIALTGNATASGTQAKSILSTVPFEWPNVLRRIIDNFLHIWIDLFTGTNNRYVAVPIVILAAVGFFKLSTITGTHRHTAILIALWLIATSAAIATLDTAFWHFKRYQIPLMALQFPLAATGLRWLLESLENRRIKTAFGLGLLAFISVITAINAQEFLRLYRVNLNNMKRQPLAMATWVQQHTNADAVVAVHDIGVMRYIGERYTVDMVGLTTPKAANYWRNGPGSVGEFLMTYEPAIDYVAAYTTARGLNYLADTPIYGNLLQGFSAIYDPADNVALGAEFQGIFQYLAPREYRDMLEIFHVSSLERGSIIDLINVADLDSEQDHAYTWQNKQPLSGFATEVYQMGYTDCELNCEVIDGGRVINGIEEFEIAVHQNRDAFLVTRIHPFASATIDVYVNDEYIATRVIPQIPGHWLDIATRIPGDLLVSDHAMVRIETSGGSNLYMPYRHLVVTEDDPGVPEENPGERLVSFEEVGRIDLTNYEITYSESTKQLTANFSWYSNGNAVGDYKFFLHVYDNPDEQPIAQADSYVDGPVGNWLPGTIEHSLSLDLSQLEPGNYQIAIGFYESQTFERLEPLQVTTELINDPDNRRVFLTEFDIASY